MDNFQEIEGDQNKKYQLQFINFNFNKFEFYNNYITKILSIVSWKNIFLQEYIQAFQLTQNIFANSIVKIILQ